MNIAKSAKKVLEVIILKTVDVDEKTACVFGLYQPKKPQSLGETKENK